MSKFRKYGIKMAINRPFIQAVKAIDLSGEEGKKLIKKETLKVLSVHTKTFKVLADM